MGTEERKYEVYFNGTKINSIQDIGEITTNSADTELVRGKDCLMLQTTATLTMTVKLSWWQQIKFRWWTRSIRDARKQGIKRIRRLKKIERNYLKRR